MLEKQGSFLGAFSLDNQVIMPLGQFLSDFWNNPDFDIQVKVADIAQLDDAREEAARRHAPHPPPRAGRAG